MTERGLPHVDGASACPFVAFDDDRDERSSVPDHRHRCFAELQPAPRALAHQEAYCLSSAFPVCPTFQDWARREAARSRDGRATPTPTPARSIDRDPVDPPVVAPGLAAATAAATEPRVRSADDRAGGSGLGDAPSDRAALRASDDEGMDDDRGPGSEKLASAADRRASADLDDDAPASRSAPRDDVAQRNPPRDWSAPPPWLASAERRRADDVAPPPFLGRAPVEPGQGLVGSPADRMTGGSGQGPSRDDDEWASAARGAPVPRGSRSDSRGDRGGDEPDIEDLDGDARGSSRRPRAYSQHLGGPDGPDWERPRRYEAYPTIKSRIGMPRVRGVPPILVMAVVIALLALALFFLPGLLNVGGGATPGGSTAPIGSVQPSPSLGPSVAPQPTAQLYTIKKGDTLSKVAASFGITIEELLAANPTIKNPNKVGLGQEIIIPAPSEAPPDTIEESPAPSA